MVEVAGSGQIIVRAINEALFVRHHGSDSRDWDLRPYRQGQPAADGLGVSKSRRGAVMMIAKFRGTSARWVVVLGFLFSAALVAGPADAAGPDTGTGGTSPYVIVGGGGGWDYSNYVVGTCGIAGVGATAAGGGYMYIQGEFDSYIYPVTSGDAWINATSNLDGTTRTFGPWATVTSSGVWSTPLLYKYFTRNQWITLRFHGYYYVPDPTGVTYCDYSVKVSAWVK